MKTEFLKELGIEDEVIKKIMAENGKDIEKEKSKTNAAKDEITDLTEQLNTTKENLEKFKDVNVDDLKGQIEKLTKDLDTQSETYQSKLAKIERQGKTKDFLSGKKFVNDETKEFYFNKLENLLDNEDSKGKSYDDLLDSMTKDEKGEYKPNVFAQENNNVSTGLYHQDNTELTGIEAEFQKLNPNIKIE